MSSQHAEWLTVRQASHHLNLSVGFLRKLVAAKKIPFTRIGTKALRFRRSDLDAWMVANTSTAPSDTEVVRDNAESSYKPWRPGGPRRPSKAYLAQQQTQAAGAEGDGGEQ